MKLSQRAQKALAQAGYSVQPDSAIAQLVAFAAQNSGMEYGNYGDRKSYQAEASSISRQWAEFKSALDTAQSEGVTDTHVIEASRSAFSGRLELKDGWSYCTGQYFCTEYRAAATAVLEKALHLVRLARPRQSAQIETIADLKALNEANGGCYFERSAMRFFGSRIESGIIRGRYFVTSECQGDGHRRAYSVRTFDGLANIDTLGEFQEHATKAEAMEAIRQDSSRLEFNSAMCAR